MNKFKICLECSTKNPPDVSDCINCDCDLMSVEITDEFAAKNFSSMERTTKTELFKICSECGAKNLPNARKCASCGEDISDIVATAESEIQAVKFALKSLDGKFTFKLDGENIIVGRENAMREYLAEKNFVSRKHCRFSVEGDEIFVEDLGSANSTYVNNKKIFGKTKLSKGDEIGLGGAIFNGVRQDKAAYFVVV